MFIRFDRIHEPDDRQTDGHTNRHRMTHRSRMHSIAQQKSVYLRGYKYKQPYIMQQIHSFFSLSILAFPASE